MASVFEEDAADRQNACDWKKANDPNTISWKTYMKKLKMEWVPQPITRDMMANLNATEVLRRTGFCLNFFDDIPWKDEQRLRAMKEKVEWFVVRYLHYQREQTGTTQTAD